MEILEFINKNLDQSKAKIILNALKQSNNENFHKFVLVNIHSIVYWLNSNEFKKYENLSYPPLANPNDLDIDSSEYCASLAWDLNIPLKNSKFVYISPHGVGAAAFLYLLNNACNVFCPASWMLENNAKYRYMLNFISCIIKNQSAINISETNIFEFDKYISLIDKNTPILFQVRDPISLLKHSYGRDWSKVERDFNPEFDINYDYSLYINYLTPKKTYMKDDFENLLENTFISWNLIHKLNKDNINYLDMSEISKDKVYNTFINLSNKFDFTPPPINTKNMFNRNEFRGYIRYLLPLRFDVDSNIRLTINRYYLDDNINIFDYISKNDLKNDIGIYIEKDKIDDFLNHKDYKKIINYLSNFLNELKKITDYTEKTMMKEEEVLNYLKENKNAREKLKNILDKDLVHIKQTRPDIVSSWKYYQEFEKLFK